MVKRVAGSGPSRPGPCQQRSRVVHSHWRLTRSNWRTWPHRKLRRKVPRVDNYAAQVSGVGAQHVGACRPPTPRHRSASCRPGYAPANCPGPDQPVHADPGANVTGRRQISGGPKVIIVGVVNLTYGFLFQPSHYPRSTGDFLPLEPQASPSTVSTSGGWG